VCLPSQPKVTDTIYRAGVIGLGVMGNIADGQGGSHPSWYRPCCHSDAYVSHVRTELAAGSTRSGKRQQLFRDKHGGLPVYSDYREMLEKEKLDIVSIATPATCHAQVVIDAAQAQVKAIYCEKAMATSLVECDAMIEACERSGTLLAINHQRRWDNRFQALVRAVRADSVGKLQAIRISFGGGRLCRGGSHMFDLACLFAEDQVATGSGWLSDSDAFDPGGIGLFETRTGIRIDIDGCLGMTHQFMMDLIGDQGVIRVVDGGFRFEWWALDSESEFGQMAERHLPMNFDVRAPMLNAVDDIVSCIESGRIPLSSGYGGRCAFEMIAAIHLSYRQDRAQISFPVEERDFRIESN